MSNGLQPIPEFADEAQERAYRESHDSADHLDWLNIKPVAFPNPEADDQNYLMATTQAFARFD